MKLVMASKVAGLLAAWSLGAVMWTAMADPPATFTPLLSNGGTDLGFVGNTWAGKISTDGSTVVGTYESNVLRRQRAAALWRGDNATATRVNVYPSSNTVASAFGTAVSRDGRWSAVTLYPGDGTAAALIFDLQLGTSISLGAGGFEGRPVSFAATEALSDDGRFAVGSVTGTASFFSRPFIYDRVTRVMGNVLSSSSGLNSGTATAIAPGGGWLFGHVTGPSGRQGLVASTLSGSVASVGPANIEFRDATVDGRIAVGFTLEPFDDVAAIYFNPALGGQGLVEADPPPAPFSSSRIMALSGDGRVKVGSFGRGWWDKTAGIWRDDIGAVHLKSWLIDEFGLGSQLAGWELTEVTDVSADGTVLVGDGIDATGRNRGWRLTIPPPRCIADFNQDGGVDGQDVAAFIQTWETGDTAADVNRDGGVDGLDVATFFVRWETGGC